MSNETDLDWLARNVHVWREGANYVCVNHTDGGHVFHEHNRNCAIWFTKAQWLARRAELQNKPSWNDAPEWVEWLAQDKSGFWYWYASKPTHPGMKSWWPEPATENNQCGKGEVLGDWRDTLEKRPEEFQPFTSIEDNQEKAMKQDNGWFERGELPPVGARCVALLGIAPKANCEVIAKTEQQMVVKWEENGMMDVIDLDVHVAFRPIRTERDVLLSIIVEEMNRYDTDGKLADAILAAGFKRELE